MKVIFLDFDGVVINMEACRNDNKPDKINIDSLNTLIERSKAKIVISSSWRIGGLSYASGMLKTWGIKGEVIGCTPYLPYIENETRGTEIQQWLDAGRELLEEPVESFVILDDDSDMGNLLPFLVRSTFEKGFLPEHVDKAMEILNTPQ